MSTLKTYGHEDTFVNGEEGTRWPLYLLNDDWSVNKEKHRFLPGDWACHINGGGTGHGLVVGVTDAEIAVLWSDEPQTFDSSSFTFPQIKRVPMTQAVVQSLISIQPTPVPSAKLFYLEYNYGQNAVDKDSTTPDAGIEVVQKK